jgi:hypothetical protein
MFTIGIKTNKQQTPTKHKHKQTNKQTNKQKTPFELKINKMKHIGHELQQKIDEQSILFHHEKRL